MITSSPDYAITKPGMSPPNHHRKREKPLRTYGRKCSSAAPEPRGEPPAKKARSESADVDTPASTQLVVLINAAPDPIFERDTLSFSDTEETSRSSILRYFRPLCALSRTQHQRQSRSQSRSQSREQMLSAKQIDTALPPVTNNENTIPCARERKRKPRLLRIRGPSSNPESSSEDGPSFSSRHIDGADNTVPSSPNDRERRTSVSPRRTWDRREETSFHKDRKKDRHRPRSSISMSVSKRLPAVQTTLNISSKAAFAECKVCDMVWNPLYPDDVKYHEKRHKAVLRRERKKEAEKL
ncbi:hypothetical protein E4U21_004708 [Claviceps maximensis]|nr:hypothetical protein E4U21_004708 [Claviceps maximensis]